MSGVIPLLPQCAFMACTGTTLPIQNTVIHKGVHHNNRFALIVRLFNVGFELQTLCRAECIGYSRMVNVQRADGKKKSWPVSRCYPSAG